MNCKHIDDSSVLMNNIYDAIISFINRYCSDDDSKRDLKVISICFVDSDGNFDGFILKNDSLK